MIDEASWQALKQAALEAGKRAYAPYSELEVGAALQTKDGSIFVGCNVENASYGATICAERAALAAAVAAGQRDPVALVIVCRANRPIPPCGICRQCLSELAVDLPIRSFAGHQQTEYQLAELLPDAFDAEKLTRGGQSKP